MALPDLELAADAMASENVFLGGPRNSFSRVGRNQLIVALDAGLTNDCTVLDIGCGCLRGGWWLINYLSPTCYYGIEPNKIMLDSSLNHLLGPKLIAEKLPSFAHNDDFDFSVFGVKFDFVIARSIWSHAPPNQIKIMLENFILNSSDEGCFLASFRETDDFKNQFQGDTWVGRSHHSDVGGMIEYTYKWISGLAVEYDLYVEKLHLDYGQRWVKFYKKSSQIQKFVSLETKNGRVLSY